MVTGEINEANKYLEFKDHKEFFEEFYNLRKNYLRRHFEFLTNASKSNLTMLSGSLIALIDWTSSQLDEHIDIEELKETIATLEKNKTPLIIYKEFDKIFRTISKIHEKTELIPKVHDENLDPNAKFWREEEHKALKEVKKAFYDILVIE